jgi:hypothetical protein
MLTIAGHKGNASQNHTEIHLTPVRMAIIKTPVTTRVGEDMGNPHTLLVGMQASTTTLENNIWLLKKLNIDLPYDPAIPLLVIHPKECDSGYSIP